MNRITAFNSSFLLMPNIGMAMIVPCIGKDPAHHIKYGRSLVDALGFLMPIRFAHDIINDKDILAWVAQNDEYEFLYYVIVSETRDYPVTELKRRLIIDIDKYDFTFEYDEDKDCENYMGEFDKYKGFIHQLQSQTVKLPITGDFVIIGDKVVTKSIGNTN